MVRKFEAKTAVKARPWTCVPSSRLKVSLRASSTSSSKFAGSLVTPRSSSSASL